MAYDRDSIENAAPLVGLGYFDLPQDLNAAGIVLGDNHVYVTAQGMNFPLIDTPFEDNTWLLVYDRENRLPGEADSDDSRDRDIIYSVPLPLSQPPAQLLVKDGLLIARTLDEGVLLISLADPDRPSVVKVLDRVLFGGVPIDLSSPSMSIRDNYLSVTATRRVGRNTIARRLVFDLNQPSIPQIGDLGFNTQGPTLGIDSSTATAAYNRGVRLFDDRNIQNPIEIAAYQENGFPLPGQALELGGQTSVIGSLNLQLPNGQPVTPLPDQTDDLVQLYLNLFDVSERDNVRVIDSVELMNNTIEYSLSLIHI